jgi:hypothetical protein
MGLYGSQILLDVGGHTHTQASTHLYGVSAVLHLPAGQTWRDVMACCLETPRHALISGDPRQSREAVAGWSPRRAEGNIRLQTTERSE